MSTMDFDIGTANVTLQLICSVILLVLIVSLFMNKEIRTRRDRLFVTVLISHVIAMLSDTVAWIFEGNKGGSFEVVLLVANVAAYCMSLADMFFFMHYLFSFISEKTNMNHKLAHLTTVLFILPVLAVGASPFTHWVFYLDVENRHQWGEYYDVFVLYLAGMFVLAAGLIIYYRETIGKKDVTTLMFYVWLPVISLLIQAFVIDLMLSYAAMTMTVLIIYVNIQSQQGKRLKEKEMELREQQITVMLSQIHPHFLYNSLTSIGQLCDMEPKKAKTAIIKFSKYLRGNMDSLSESSPISFKEELEHVKHYLWLEKVRFEERLEVVYDIRTEDFVLPTLTLQPVVENAVRHGITKRKGGGTVTITSVETEADYIVMVQDDGAGFDQNEQNTDGQSHIGIANVKDRLWALCKGSLEVQSMMGKGTKVTIKLPKKMQ